MRELMDRALALLLFLDKSHNWTVLPEASFFSLTNGIGFVKPVGQKTFPEVPTHNLTLFQVVNNGAN